MDVDEDLCPGSGRLMADPASFCTAPTESSTIMAAQHDEPAYVEPAIMAAQHDQPAKSGPLVPGVIGFAVGAAVVTSVVVMKKKRNPADTYSPLLAEDTA